MCSYVSLKSATVSAVFILSDISSFTFEMNCVCIHCVSETVMIQVFNLATLNPMDMDWGQNVRMMLLPLNMMDVWKCAKKTCLTSMPECYAEINVVVNVNQLLRLQLADWSDVVEVNQLLKQHCRRRSHSIHYWRYLCGFWNCESATESICRVTTCLIGTKKLTSSPHSWDTDDQCVCLVWHRTSSNMPYHKLHMGHKSTASHWSDSHTQRPWYILE